MSTRKSARRPVRKTTTKLPPPPHEYEITKRARMLPMFGPGITIRVALPLWPAYKGLYQLVPMSPGEVGDTEKRLGRRKPDDVVWVKRVPRQELPKETVTIDVGHFDLPKEPPVGLLDGLDRPREKETLLKVILAACIAAGRFVPVGVRKNEVSMVMVHEGLLIEVEGFFALTDKAKELLYFFYGRKSS